MTTTRQPLDLVPLQFQVTYEPSTSDGSMETAAPLGWTWYDTPPALADVLTDPTKVFGEFIRIDGTGQVIRTDTHASVDGSEVPSSFSGQNFPVLYTPDGHWYLSNPYVLGITPNMCPAPPTDSLAPFRFRGSQTTPESTVDPPVAPSNPNYGSHSGAFTWRCQTTSLDFSWDAAALDGTSISNVVMELQFDAVTLPVHPGLLSRTLTGGGTSSAEEHVDYWGPLTGAGPWRRLLDAEAPGAAPIVARTPGTVLHTLYMEAGFLDSPFDFLITNLRGVREYQSTGTGPPMPPRSLAVGGHTADYSFLDPRLVAPGAPAVAPMTPLS